MQADKLREIAAFLCGDGTLDGFWFGERPMDRAPFWWRTQLRKDIDELLAIAEAAEDLRADVLACFPTNWCDPLLTGPEASKVPLDCPAVERLLTGLRKRVAETFDAALSTVAPVREG